MSQKYYDLDPEGFKLQNFEFIFSKFGLPSKVIEVGCYAGMTTGYLVGRIAPEVPSLQYIAIDPYSSSVDIGEDLNKIYEFFTTNLDNFKFKNNIKLYRDTSTVALIRLFNEGFKPQLIYVDGDHTASTVLSDLVLGFEILEQGGMIVCDDSVHWKYKDKNGTTDPQMSPRMAVETFIMCNWSKLNIITLPFGTQTAFVKL